MRHPAQGVAGGWVMPGLVFSGFLCVSSHYLTFSRVSSWGCKESDMTERPN